jgi:hypothetical protein
MQTYITVVDLATQIVEADAKLQALYTKAESQRQRVRINELKKLASDAKRELLAKDAS